MTLRPEYNFENARNGTWLLHTENGGYPHCVGLKFEDEEQISVYDAAQMYKCTRAQFESMLAASLESKTFVFFQVSDEGAPEMEPLLSRMKLLDLQAGALAIFDCDVAQVLRDRPGSDDDSACEDESIVRVDEQLAKSLSNEVTSFMDRVERHWSKVKGGSDDVRCPFCPFKSFQDKDRNAKRRLLSHVRRYHGASQSSTGTPSSFVASGIKQFKVIKALYDRDTLLQVNGTNYLCRSAETLRSSIRPALSSTDHRIDRKIVFFIGKDGPEYINVTAARESSGIRRLGYTYFGKDFAEDFLHEVAISFGRVKPARARLIRQYARCGNQLFLLLPTNVRTWLEILEDIMRSPCAHRQTEVLIGQCVAHKEFRCISMDATLRIAMRVRGQANYRQSIAIRNAAPVGDEEALRRVLTIRGRTGAVLAMAPIRSEGAADIRDFFMGRLPEDVRNQIEYVASDQPSVVLHAHLAECCPSFKALYLDPVHLVIVYNTAMWRKSTPGQVALRRMQDKFNKVDDGIASDSWGQIFTGSYVPMLTREEDS